MTKKMLPSPAQMRVLIAALAAGDGGLCRDQWFAIPTTAQTRRAVRLAGWIERVDDLSGNGLPNTTWFLTNLGRHALEAARASKGAE